MELLSSLFYPEHEARRENVKPPWENTFQWIFQDVILILPNGTTSLNGCELIARRIGSMGKQAPENLH